HPLRHLRRARLQAQGEGPRRQRLRGAAQACDPAAVRTVFSTIHSFERGVSMNPHSSGSHWLFVAVLSLGLTLLGNTATAADKEKRDIFNYEAQQAAKNVQKIVFVADTAPHGPRGNHEFLAGAIYLARTINAEFPNAYAVVYTKDKWPKDLKHADAVIVLLNHGGSAVNPAVKEAMARGAGFMAIHYGVEVNKGDQGKHYLKWMGGYFEPFWSVNPWWTPEFKDIPKHPTTNGVKPFAINDEWYYHMRFVDDMKGVTPILAALPPLKTISWSESPSNQAIKEAINLLKERK